MKNVINYKELAERVYEIGIDQYRQLRDIFDKHGVNYDSNLLYLQCEILLYSLMLYTIKKHTKYSPYKYKSEMNTVIFDNVDKNQDNYETIINMVIQYVVNSLTDYDKIIGAGNGKIGDTVAFFINESDIVYDESIILLDVFLANLFSEWKTECMNIINSYIIKE